MIRETFRKLVKKTIIIDQTMTRKYYRITFLKPSMSKITRAAAVAVGATHEQIPRKSSK